MEEENYNVCYICRQSVKPDRIITTDKPFCEKCYEKATKETKKVN